MQTVTDEAPALLRRETAARKSTHETLAILTVVGFNSGKRCWQRTTGSEKPDNQSVAGLVVTDKHVMARC
jgi:hypothetical protein